MVERQLQRRSYLRCQSGGSPNILSGFSTESKARATVWPCLVRMRAATLWLFTLSSAIRAFSGFYCFLYTRLSTIHVDSVHGVGVGIGPVRSARISDPLSSITKLNVTVEGNGVVCVRVMVPVQSLFTEYVPLKSK